MDRLLILFIVLNIINVMLQTFKTLCTVNSGKYTAAITNAIAYGFYTVVVIYMLCDLPTWTKAAVVGLCNLVGVFIVKYIEERRRKDKLWKIEFTVKDEFGDAIINYLDEKNISYNFNVMLHQHYTVFNAFCSTKTDAEIVKKAIEKYNAKYFVSESKIL